MADIDERLIKAQQRADIAEGFMTDAEFREEHEARQIRYLQATCSALLAIFIQNQVIIDLLKKEQDADSLGARR